MIVPDHDAPTQRALLLLLHQLHPTIPTREVLHRALIDSHTSNDDAQRAIDNLTSLGVVEVNHSDRAVRLPLPILTALELVER